jgi:hypothetical protein
MQSAPGPGVAVPHPERGEADTDMESDLFGGEKGPGFARELGAAAAFRLFAYASFFGVFMMCFPFDRRDCPRSREAK